MNEYIIINKTELLKRIEELEKGISLCKPEQQLVKDLLMQELEIRKQILSKSTPLIPEIEKAFDEGSEYPRIGGSYPLFEMTKEQEHAKQFYISNLKLDI